MRDTYIHELNIRSNNGTNNYIIDYMQTDNKGVRTILYSCEN